MNEILFEDMNFGEKKIMEIQRCGHAIFYKGSESAAHFLFGYHDLVDAKFAFNYLVRKLRERS